jgi:periplasmic divalent cation tolerance protein
MELSLVMTTCNDRQQAERLARLLVESHLAACVSIGAPVTSVFPWKGQIDSEQEVTLTIKTRPERLPALKQAFNDHHPYEVPEMLVLPVVDGLKPYFDWAREWIDHESDENNT